MLNLSLQLMEYQTQVQDQSFEKFLKIEHSEWLQREHEELVARLQEERDQNGFIEASERTRVSRKGISFRQGLEGYGPSVAKPQVELTERHYSWLQNQPSTVAPGACLQKQLLEQLLDAKIDYDDLNYEFGQFVISHIDKFGLLAESIDDLFHHFNEFGGCCSEQEAEKTLRCIQQFDPPGVAAQSTLERLNLILNRLEKDGCYLNEFDPPLQHLAILYQIAEHVDLLTGGECDELCMRLGLGLDIIRDAVDELRRVLQRFNLFDDFSTASELIAPDITFSLTVDGQIGYHVALPRAANATIPQVYHSIKIPRVRIEEFNKAQQVVSAVKGRYQILDSIAQALIQLQGDFIRFGKHHLKPLLQKTLAQNIHEDDSIVSRVLNGGRGSHSKQIGTPHGIYPIKVCFPKEVIAGSGVLEEQLRAFLTLVLANEPKDTPWSDQRIAAEIDSKFNLRLARKTVHKYRNKFGIGTAKQRALSLTRSA